ncbi:uncharacterized protein LOC116417003 isoform X1 [Nasonia vitripennis]|uniref:Uncharacterized protein n=1 Tax=Nasonia vitripennis TaxID=7425 RepID=A0A7M7QDG0_NASVI|nr:uncharacterized protein LOC116417003 isoform X1 [Nasonia vitripennis]
MGIAPKGFDTLGTVKLTVMGKKHIFHVLPSSIPLHEDIILGNPFLYGEKVNIQFGDEVLITESQPITPVPFVHKHFPENQEDVDIKYGQINVEGQSSEGKETAVEEYEFPYESEAIDPKVQDLPTRPYNPNGFKLKANTVFKLPARAKVPVRIPATEDSVQGQAYLRLIKTVPGVYIGEAAVMNEKGYCYAMAINTREDPVEIEISPQHLEEFDLSEDDDFLDFPLEGEAPKNSEERINFIMEKVRKTYHKRHELRQIQRIVKKYSHLFYLPGDPAPRTSCVRHKIRTTDEEPVRVKYKRGPTGQEEELFSQLQKLLDARVIRRSNSPFCSPCRIVPKKPGPDGKRKYSVPLKMWRTLFLTLFWLTDYLGLDAESPPFYKLTELKQNPGIYYEYMGEVKIERVKWKIAVTLDFGKWNDPIIWREKQMFKVVTTCNEQLSKQECKEFLSIDKFELSIKTLKSLQEDLHIFFASEAAISDNRFTPYTHALSKRGAPLEFIGWTSRQLFGTMDAGDRDQLNQDVDRLYEKTSNISTLLASQTHIVKSNLESLHQKLDDTQKTLHEQHLQFLRLANRTNQFENFANRSTIVQTLLKWVYHFDQSLEHSINSYKTLVNTIETATRGHLHPLLLTHSQQRRSARRGTVRRVRRVR